MDKEVKKDMKQTKPVTLDFIDYAIKGEKKAIKDYDGKFPNIQHDEKDHLKALNTIKKSYTKSRAHPTNWTRVGIYYEGAMKRKRHILNRAGIHTHVVETRPYVYELFVGQSRYEDALQELGVE